MFRWLKRRCGYISWNCAVGMERREPPAAHRAARCHKHRRRDGELLRVRDSKGKPPLIVWQLFKLSCHSMSLRLKLTHKGEAALNKSEIVDGDIKNRYPK